MIVGKHEFGEGINFAPCLNLLYHGVCSSVASLDTSIAKRVLRHRPSRRYFNNGEWTRHLEEATEFGSIREIIETCARHELQEIDLVLRSERGCIEIIVKVR